MAGVVETTKLMAKLATKPREWRATEILGGVESETIAIPRGRADGGPSAEGPIPTDGWRPVDGYTWRFRSTNPVRC